MTAVVARRQQGARTAVGNHLGPLSMDFKAGFTVVRTAPDGEVTVRNTWAAP